jgi:hypothetical protein
MLYLLKIFCRVPDWVAVIPRQRLPIHVIGQDDIPTHRLVNGDGAFKK